jgi:hypothetical protein
MMERIASAARQCDGRFRASRRDLIVKHTMVNLKALHFGCGEDDTVATRSFGFVKTGVRDLQQFSCAGRMFRESSDAGGKGNRIKRDIVVLQFESSSRDPQKFRPPCRVLSR